MSEAGKDSSKRALVISEEDGSVVEVLLVEDAVDVDRVCELAGYYSQSVVETDAVTLGTTEEVEQYIREELNQGFGLEDGEDGDEEVKEEV